MTTGKSRTINVLGRELTFYNQRCRDWTHPYAFNNDSNLNSAGCGIFSLCHCAQWLTGQAQDPELWADFSCANGARDNTGTDRPTLLHAVMTTGNSELMGFRYEDDGLRNDLDTLYDFLLNERGVAMCNLRVGHIVVLVAAREKDGERQVLAIDSYSESASDRVKDNVVELVPDTEISYTVKNAAGLDVGTGVASAAYWVKATTPRDFNLLHRLG